MCKFNGKGLEANSTNYTIHTCSNHVDIIHINHKYCQLRISKGSESNYLLFC